MSDTPRPLFIDTSGFFARVVEDDANHEQATAVFEMIATDKVYGPVFTSRYVLAELATLLLYRSSHRDAATALAEIRDSETITLLPVDSTTFTQTCKQFKRYDDQGISFIDHLSGILATTHDIQHVFAFDSDFATLGFTRVPIDTELQ